MTVASVTEISAASEEGFEAAVREGWSEPIFPDQWPSQLLASGT
jgi:hypothetical protein